MDHEHICRILPEKPPKGLIRWARKKQTEEIGGEYMAFRGVRAYEQPSMEQLMDNDLRRRSTWAAECTCGDCGVSFITKKVTYANAIQIATGEDGMSYTVDPFDDGNYTSVVSGEQLLCPYCGEWTTLVHENEIRGGRTKRLQVAALHAVEGYAVIVYWLVEREILSCGSIVSANPRYAYVLGEKGGIYAYSNRRPGIYGKDHPAKAWRQLSGNDDRWDTQYGDWGSINNTKAGTAMYPGDLPSLIGTTGEKTGLLEYWKAGGAYPLKYLKLWKAWKPVENLVNAGFSKLVAEVVENADRYSVKTKMARYADLTKTRPHEILRMSKEDFRRTRESGKKIGAVEIGKWNTYRSLGGQLGAYDFLCEISLFGAGGSNNALILMQKYGDCDFPKISRYLEKQRMRKAEAGILLDTRDMYRQLYGRQELTSEELWPKHLMQTHDRLTVETARMRSSAENRKYQEAFDTVVKTYQDIQWTDKNLAVILPKSASELTEEGKVLRHCVGTYVNRHSEGEDIILFVRHYRRPERSYYTLNISFRSGEPREIQLHGYGNERHGKNKEHSHRIPQKVRAFVDRWEKEILLPWWRDQQKTKKAKEKRTA